MVPSCRDCRVIPLAPWLTRSCLRGRSQPWLARLYWGSLRCARLVTDWRPGARRWKKWRRRNDEDELPGTPRGGLCAGHAVGGGHAGRLLARVRASLQQYGAAVTAGAELPTGHRGERYRRAGPWRQLCRPEGDRPLGARRL